jgi:hypothetical protein
MGLTSKPQRQAHRLFRERTPLKRAKVLPHRSATLAVLGGNTGVAMPDYGEILAFLAANPPQAEGDRELHASLLE